MGERQSLAFLLCVEAGALEPQALLLARSIRRWAGDYAGNPIHAFRPRVGPDLDPGTYAGLEELGVVLHEEVLNRDHHDYVHVNTTYAMIWAEEHLDAEIVAWCDSDNVFLRAVVLRPAARHRRRGNRALLPRPPRAEERRARGPLRPLLAAAL